ncbi:MAG: Fic family protein [Peptococcaceae bacterium]|jgi:Fic family protein|nr:Fic family protein [Peptococcaceae bacterium]
MDFMTVKEAAACWGISDRRVRIICAEGKIDGVTKKGRAYLIPTNALKPADGRAYRGVKISEQYAAQFAAIDAGKNELNRRRPLTQGELQRLRDEFLVDFTYNSNAIEGNTLTLKETALALEGVTIDKKPLKDHLEAVGHRDAFVFVEERVGEKSAVSEHIIKEIHSLVLLNRPEDKGIYRRMPVQIMGAFNQPPQPYLVPVKMESLVADYAKDNRHPIEKTALFHLNFEGVHPFIDGNGRTGRLLLNLMLMQAGYPPVNVKFTDRQRYYACFDSYYRDSDASPMVTMLAEYMSERLRQYFSILGTE